MNSFDKTMTRFHSLRGKFEELLEAARKKSSPARARTEPTAALREITAFGRNPGNLRMFVHIPERLPTQAPLVVALHGCGQTAGDYDQGAGWSSLADRLGFVVLYPEQQPANNPKNCFSWFLPGDTTRDQGEASSIRQMVEHAIGAFGIDRRKVFVTGLSAGGAMASVMLATYPEVFAGGAIIAGLAYGSARSVQQAFDAMFTERSTPPAVLGDYVRAASKHRGPWPKISVWHGSADPIVKPSNAEDIVRQWTDVHGFSSAPSYEESIGAHRRRVWNDPDGNAAIEAFFIGGMGHGVPLGAATSNESCGAAGPFFLEAGISSTHRIAGFWQLDQDLVWTPRRSMTATASSQTREIRPALAAAAAIVAPPANPSVEPNAEQHARRAYEPNPVIAAAFKAAGLPLPKLPSASSDFAPGPIIEAALKAAGLKGS
jgi:poly(hydroxyalkanoate) depolymerase family esterase